ncbi:MAG: c-type cytochrome [Proteobacteria bacterium]|nr:c-type cytochrome [Pseudomonadota bacterium]
MRRLILAAALALSACVAPPPPSSPTSQPGVANGSQDTLISDGRDIAEAQCARCHAVGTYGDSPNPAAPTFRTVLSRYRAEVLEEELREGIQVAHPMPDFQFEPQGVHALVAYLRSIQEPARRG